MEASATDPFAGGVEHPTDDPFAEKPGEAGAFEQEDDPFGNGEQAVTDQPVEGRPIVDAEGNEKKNPPTSTTEDATTQVAASVPSEATEETDEEREQREAAEAEADRAEAEADAAMGGEPAAAPVADPPPAAASTSSEEPGAAAGSEAAPAAKEPESEVPEPERNDKGETVKRGYRLIAPDGQGKWRDVTWHEDENGKVVDKGAPGAKKVNVATVRGQADALRIGFRAMGSPEGGCSLAAIPAKYFRVRHIAPDIEPQPRQRVKIS